MKIELVINEPTCVICSKYPYMSDEWMDKHIENDGECLHYESKTN